MTRSPSDALGVPSSCSGGHISGCQRGTPPARTPDVAFQYAASRIAVHGTVRSPSIAPTSCIGFSPSWLTNSSRARAKVYLWEFISPCCRCCSSARICTRCGHLRGLVTRVIIVSTSRVVATRAASISPFGNLRRASIVSTSLSVLSSNVAFRAILSVAPGQYTGTDSSQALRRRLSHDGVISSSTLFLRDALSMLVEGDTDGSMLIPRLSRRWARSSSAVRAIG